MEKRDAKAEFLTAFWKLYEKKELEKISIRELCQTAGYNRTTFYVYYDDIYDLLDKAIESIFLPIREETKDRFQPRAAGLSLWGNLSSSAPERGHAY